MIHILKGDAYRNVWLDGKLISPARSQMVCNYSPDGFNWGYGGDGPTQLALAIMLELNNKADGYQDFKWRIIAEIPKGPFETDFDYPAIRNELYYSIPIPKLSDIGRRLSIPTNIKLHKVLSLLKSGEIAVWHYEPQYGGWPIIVYFPDEAIKNRFEHTHQCVLNAVHAVPKALRVDMVEAISWD